MTKSKTNKMEFMNRVNESQGIIHKVCRLYCDDETHRQDLFQEIMLQLWRSYPSFKGKSKFSSWMYRVALNIAIQDFQKEKKRKYFFLQAYEFKEPQPSNNKEFDNEMVQRLHQAIAKLDKVEKAIMLLHLDELPNEEIAKIVGITQNHVRVKMTRIRKKIAKTFKNE